MTTTPLSSADLLVSVNLQTKAIVELIAQITSPSPETQRLINYLRNQMALQSRHRETYADQISEASSLLEGFEDFSMDLYPHISVASQAVWVNCWMMIPLPDDRLSTCPNCGHDGAWDDPLPTLEELVLPELPPAYFRCEDCDHEWNG